MEDDNKRKIFNSTEINMEQIEKKGKSDERDVLSEYEVNTYPTPYISVPRMNEAGEESTGGACETSIYFDMDDKQEISSKLQEQENEKIRIGMAEASLEPSSLDEQEQEITNLRIEMDEAAHGLYTHYMKGLEAMLQQMLILKKTIKEATPEIPPQDVQKQVNKNIVTEIEDMQKSPPRYEQELGKESIPGNLPMKCPEVTLQEQSDGMRNLEINDSLKNNTVISSSALFSKSEDRTAERESVSKVKADNECQVFQRGDSESV